MIGFGLVCMLDDRVCMVCVCVCVCV